MKEASEKPPNKPASPKQARTEHPVVELFAHLLAAKLLRDMGVASRPQTPVQPKPEPPR